MIRSEYSLNLDYSTPLGEVCSQFMLGIKERRLLGNRCLHCDRLYVPVSSLEEVLAADPEYACCTFRGSVVALAASTGDLVWKSFTIPEVPSPRGRNPDGAFLMGPAGGAVSKAWRMRSAMPDLSGII